MSPALGEEQSVHQGSKADVGWTQKRLEVGQSWRPVGTGL